MRSDANIDRFRRRLRLNQLALAAAMEAIPTSAFLAGPHGEIVHSNSLGRSALARGRSRSVDTTGDFIVTTIRAAGLPAHTLLVRRQEARDPAPLVEAWRPRLRLTARQAEVLALLVTGQANKTLAAALDCAVGTVELHVTALLRKAGVQSRAELIALFWSMSPR